MIISFWPRLRATLLARRLRSFSCDSSPLREAHNSIVLVSTVASYQQRGQDSKNHHGHECCENPAHRRTSTHPPRQQIWKLAAELLSAIVVQRCLKVKRHAEMQVSVLHQQARIRVSFYGHACRIFIAGKIAHSQYPSTQHKDGFDSCTR